VANDCDQLALKSVFSFGLGGRQSILEHSTRGLFPFLDSGFVLVFGLAGFGLAALVLKRWTPNVLFTLA
jgi:hypothetical protein